MTYHIERLPSGSFGVYRDDGYRVSVCTTRKEAKSKLRNLRRRGK